MSDLHQADIDRILEIWEAAVRATHDFLGEGEFAFYKPHVRDACSEFEVTLLRDKGGRILGFMGVGPGRATPPFVAPSTESWGRVEMLFVDPAHHRKGVGSALLRAACSRFVVTDVDVNEQNAGATAFYRALGFMQAGRSATDGQGRPHPLLHFRFQRT